MRLSFRLCRKYMAYFESFPSLKLQHAMQRLIRSMPHDDTFDAILFTFDIILIAAEGTKQYLSYSRLELLRL